MLITKFLFRFFSDVKNCKDLKEKGYAKTDGHYFLHPNPKCDKAIKVYCYDMDSPEPKDFITLPNGPENNIAYVYEKRMDLSKKFECEGPAGPLVYSKAGRTHFSKVGILSFRFSLGHHLKAYNA